MTTSLKPLPFFHILARAGYSISFRSRRGKCESLTSSQYAVLCAIERQPAEGMCEITDSVGIDRSTLGDLVARLADRGYLTCSLINKKTWRVMITSSGRAVMEEFSILTEKREREFLAKIGDAAAQEEFVRILSNLVTNLETGKTF